MIFLKVCERTYDFAVSSLKRANVELTNENIANKMANISHLDYRECKEYLDLITHEEV